MAIDIRLPNINATSEMGQLTQIRSYLYQFAEQMRWALNTIEGGNTSSVVNASTGRTYETAEPNDAESTFNSIKSLIIKSADIFEAYYDKINANLDGLYVAQSDFGTYVNETNQKIEANSEGIRQHYENIQKILSDIDAINEIVSNAYIKTGLLDYADDGTPIYGLEIGQKNEVEGVEVFDKFARFTSDRMSFYDQNDTEVAYISDYKLYITNAEITGTLTLGGYKIDTSNGLSFKWVGRG